MLRFNIQKLILELNEILNNYLKVLSKDRADNHEGNKKTFHLFDKFFHLDTIFTTYQF